MIDVLKIDDKGTKAWHPGRFGDRVIGLRVQGAGYRVEVGGCRVQGDWYRR